MHRKRAWMILGDLRKVRGVESCRPKKKSDFFLLAKLLRQGAHVLGGADGKVKIERLCLSPYVEKPFNSKVIKSFVPELRSRKCFSCFGIPMLSLYMLWTFYVRFTYSCMSMLHMWRCQKYLSQDGSLFLHVWSRGSLALDPSQNKSQLRFLLRTPGNWQIMWGLIWGGVRGVMVIVVGNGHGDTSSNPGQG